MLRRVIKLLVIIVAALLLIPVLVLALSAFEHSRAETEQYQVYSAYLTHEFAHDAHDWGEGQGISIIIFQQTQTADPFWHRFAVPEPWSFIKQTQRSTRISFRLAGLFSTRLEPKFALPKSVEYHLLAREELDRLTSLPGEFEKQFPNNLGSIGLSAVGFNSNRTEALFYINHYCGLCGGGRYVLMKKVKGNWEIAAERYTWWS